MYPKSSLGKEDDGNDMRSMNDQTDNVSINTAELYHGLQDGDHYNHDDTFEDEITPEEEASATTELPRTKRQPWKEIFMLSFSSLGAIYGDLGTSPLYVLNSIKYSETPPNREDIYGAISVIFYLFTIIVIFKYVCIVLVLGPNNGEGGQVAIYAKIARYLKIGPKGVTIPGGSKETSDLQLLTRQDTTASSVASVISRINQIKQHPTMVKVVQLSILSACFLGCSLVMSDGLLTPTTSVLSAIGGIQVAVPSFNSVLAVSEVILIALFVIQQLGSNKISFLFAPIIFVWLMGLMVCGIYNIVKFHPGIFAALSPYYAIKLLKKGGVDVFSGAMLAITGTEAMFADIGHFGKLPIQLTLGGFVYPALMLCYLGQGAYIIKYPDAYINPFFLSLPGGTGSGIYWFMFVFATLSTIIASQALILSVFSIISQLINLDCFPKLKIVHTSSHYAGKVYIPTINWILMIGVICTTAGFKNSNNVTAAYGLGISLDFIVTSFLLIICMFYVYNANVIWPILFLLIFVPLEACMVIANLKKVPHGAWFPVLMAGLFFIFLSVWRWARSKKVNHEYAQRIRIDELFPFFAAKSITVNLNPNANSRANSTTAVGENVTIYEKNEVKCIFGTQELQKHHGIGFMYVDSMLSGSPNSLPELYGKLVKSFVSIPSNFIFVGIRVLSIPYVGEEDRILMAPMKLTDHYKCILRFGFMEDIQITKELSWSIMQRIPRLTTLSTDQLEQMPTLHFFENDLIKCHEYKPSSKWKFVRFLGKSRHLVRKLVIEHFFSPLYSITQEYGRFLKCDDGKQEQDDKIFLGGIARI
ncbi:uncharacterized protein LODBEIA_P04890 [Lodderomyces beijingensis]|uniref:High affinity potassium transporter n=1 Tax=Lodderomyces beijingensis TaxID=1775926 RepID=A0ABP0ZDL2_9ASCO